MPIGGGIGLARMAAISCSALALGMTDSLFGTFILDALRQFGASKSTSFIAIAAGSLISIFTAPLAGAYGGRSVRMRRNATFVCFTVASFAALTVGIIAGDRSVTFDGPRSPSKTKVAVLCVLTAVYRSATQASPAVPMCIDAAHHKTRGDEETSLVRIKVGVSFWYLWYRLGFLVANIVLSSLPKKDADGLFPFFVSSAVVFILTLGVTAIAMPTESIQPKTAGDLESDEESSSLPPTLLQEPRSAVVVALEDMKKVTLKSSFALKCLFLETILYGVAFGLLSVIVAPFYNEVIFKKPPGASPGVKWQAYSALIAWAVGIVHDATIGTVAFSSGCSPYGMPVIWAAEMLLGVSLFTSLYWISNKNVALVVFGFLSVAVSSQNFFSLVSAGALPDEPRLRPAAFGVRAACLNIGALIGTVVAALVADGEDGFRPVMLLCACSLGLATSCVFGIGSVDGTRFSDMPINANPLGQFFVHMDENEFVKAVTGVQKR